MEILLWLLPAVVVTTIVAIVVGLRRGSGQPRDEEWTREEAARQMGEALSRRVEGF